MEQTRELKADTLTFKRIDELELKADVYGAGREMWPAILWIHGGALILGSRIGIPADQLRAYLDAGYRVVSADYRLAPETKIDGILGDLKDVWTWLCGEGAALCRIRPDRLAVIGHSAGGYLSLMAGFCVRPRPRALVSFYGYGDIIGPWYSKPDPFYCRQPMVSAEEASVAVGARPIADAPEGNQRGRFYLFCRQQGLWPKLVTGRDPDAEPRAYDPWCPVRHVEATYPPTLLLHGDGDTDVPYELSVAMAQELARANVEHELVTVPGGEHGFDQGEGGISSAQAARPFRRVLGFLKRHLG